MTTRILKSISKILLVILFATTSIHASQKETSDLFSKIKNLYSRVTSKESLGQSDQKFAAYQDFIENIDTQCAKNCKNPLEQLEKFNAAQKHYDFDKEFNKLTTDSNTETLIFDKKMLDRLESLFEKNPSSLKARVKSSLEGLKALLNIEKNNLNIIAGLKSGFRKDAIREIHEDTKYLFRQAQSLYKIHNILKNQGNTLTLNEREARDIIFSLNGLGITYVKLAQTVSSVMEEIPEPLARAMKGLSADNTELSPELARATLKKELGFEPTSIFKDLNFSQPVAKGTLGYAYSAKLQNESGEWKDVIIKIQRPDLIDSIEQSRKFHGMFMKFSQAAVSHINLSPVLDIMTNELVGIEKSIQGEMDYRREAKNMERFAKYFQNNKQISVPKVYSKYTTSKIIVMESAEGQTLDINLRKVMTAYKEKGFDPKSTEARTLEKTFSLLLQNLAYMTLVTKEVHADLRPENFISNLKSDEKGLSLDSKMTLIDFGKTIKLNGLLIPPAAAGLNLLIGDAEGFTKRLLQIGETPTDSQKEILKVVEKNFLKYGIEKIGITSFIKRKGHLNDIGALREAVLDIASEVIRDHGYRPDLRYTEALRSLAPMGLTLWTLGRRFDGLTLARLSILSVSKGVLKGSLGLVPQIFREQTKGILQGRRCEAVFR